MPDYIYTGCAVKEIDRIAIAEHGYKGFELMTKAGERAMNVITQRIESPGEMLVVCGPGNNGGDGYIVAAIALEQGWTVSLLNTAKPKTVDAISAAQRFLQAGGVFTEEYESLDPARFDVVVDAVLGVGIRGAPADRSATLIEFANRCNGFKLAIDVPSGVDSDTGAALSPCFRADATITFIAAKLGLLTGPALDLVGELTVETLGIGTDVTRHLAPCAEVLESPAITSRPLDSHKGEFGHVVIAGGDNGMLGAVLLAGRAALRSGAGKVHVLSTDEHIDRPALVTPELMSAVFEPQNFDLVMQADAIGLGPGLGLSAWGRGVFDAITTLPNTMIIDADALTLLAATERKSEQANWVLTPHPGEAARLLDWPVSDVQRDRYEAACKIAEERNSVCVLKGAGTLIATPERKVFICDRGNPGMASAGMGDVLTGMIAAYLGLGMVPIDAAKAAVFLHADVADHCVTKQNQASLIASDVIECLCRS